MNKMKKSSRLSESEVQNHMNLKLSNSGGVREASSDLKDFRQLSENGDKTRAACGGISTGWLEMDRQSRRLFRMRPGCMLIDVGENTPLV